MRSRLRILFWVTGLAIAVFQVITYRQWVNGDAISYFDMSDAIPTHDWGRLINATWSPLYPALLGLASAIAHPSAAAEFPIAHVVNLLCFVLAFAGFEFLLGSLLVRKDVPGDQPGERLPERALLLIGYSLFLWASLGMLTLMKPTPDMLMSALLYFSAGLLVRVRSGAGWPTCAILGVVLGLGYLSKAIMFPLSVLMLGTLLLGSGRRVLRTAVAGLGFVLVAAPYAVAVSRLAHRGTFGEAATVVRLINVDRVATYFQGVGGASGRFIHPVTPIASGNPAAFSFERPLAVTYALWYDPYYWTEGVRPTSQYGRRARIFRDNLVEYGRIALRLGGLVAVLLFLGWTAGVRGSIRALGAFWPLGFIGAAALGAYATLHVEERYIGAFIALTGISLLCGFRRSPPLSSRTVNALVAVVMINLGIHTAVHLRRDITENESKTRLRDDEAAVELHRMGIATGDPVASINPFVASGWARLARVRIIAEVQRTRAEQFWKATPEYQAQVIAAFSAAGCKVVVAWIGDGTAPAGWRRLGSSAYAVKEPSA